MGKPSIANFQDDLQFSEAASDEPFWDAIYKKAFPNLVNHMACGGNNDSQRRGVDRVIHLANGKTLYIDEKKRREDWDDILLEYISVDTTNAPGWMEKDLAIDYLAYAFMPSRTVYLFPWSMLQRAWWHYKESWLEKYQLVPAQNNGYTTWSVAIPISVLRGAVAAAAIIKV